jgi:hypothetical protein
MIDFDDAGEATSAALWSGGWVGLLILVFAAVLYVIAAANQRDCSKQRCASGAAQLVDHECACVSKPEAKR